MSELENALRNALAKGDASDPAFRQRVYRAAADAIQRTLTAKQADDALIREQKARLAEAIRTVEGAYEAAEAEERAKRPPEPRLDEPSVEGPEASFGDLRAEPRVDAVREGGAANDRGAPVGERRERGERRSAKRRAPLALALSVVVLLGIVVVGGWWVMSTGAFQSAAERDNSVPNPPLQLDNESFEGNRDTGSNEAPRTLGDNPANSEEWIALFEPADPTTVSLRGDATATVDSDAFGEYLRIVSPDAESGVDIDVPPGALEALAGQSAQLSIVASTAAEQPVEISVTCDLGTFGDCGRRRFTVTQSENEFLFVIELPQGTTSRAGSISISADTGSEDNAVKLSAMRVRRFQE